MILWCLFKWLWTNRWRRKREANLCLVKRDADAFYSRDTRGWTREEQGNSKQEREIENNEEEARGKKRESSLTLSLLFSEESQEQEPRLLFSLSLLQSASIRWTVHSEILWQWHEVLVPSFPSSLILSSFIDVFYMRLLVSAVAVTASFFNFFSLCSSCNTSCLRQSSSWFLLLCLNLLKL